MIQPLARNLSGRLASIYEIPSAARVPAMEGIRGAAVILVFFVHFNVLYAAYLPPQLISARLFHWAGLVGNTGVDLFFLLSGYLIYHMVQGGKKSIPQFLARRVQRIYPAFLAVCAIYVLFMRLLPETSRLPQQTGAAILYLFQNALLLPGLFSIRPLVSVAWSLSYEIFYYAALPLFYWILRMRGWSGAARARLFGALALAYCLFCMRWWNFDLPSLALRPGQHVRLIMFAGGILVCETLLWPGARRWLNRGLEYITLALIAAAFAAIPAVRGVEHAAVFQAAMVFAAFTPLGICGLGQPEGILSRFFSWTPLRWLGNISYSYYLSHSLVMHIFLNAASRVPGYQTVPAAWALLGLSFAATWAGATVLFVFIEKPFSLTPVQQRRKDVAVAQYS